MDFILKLKKIAVIVLMDTVNFVPYRAYLMMINVLMSALRINNLIPLEMNAFQNVIQRANNVILLTQLNVLPVLRQEHQIQHLINVFVLKNFLMIK